MQIIKDGAQKIRVIFHLLILTLIYSPFLFAQNIDIAPLINLDDLEPSYDEDNIDNDYYNGQKENDFTARKTQIYEEPFATISLLNKITAEVKTIDIILKKIYHFDELKIYAIDCYNSKVFEKKETAVYLNIYIDETAEKIFNGWMIKSLPSVSSMEHPIYDIWVDQCYKS